MSLQNYYGGLHGGAVAIIVELVSIACARTVVAEDKELFLGELSMSYLSAAPAKVSLLVLTPFCWHFWITFPTFRCKNSIHWRCQRAQFHGLRLFLSSHALFRQFKTFDFAMPVFLTHLVSQAKFAGSKGAQQRQQFKKGSLCCTSNAHNAWKLSLAWCLAQMRPPPIQLWNSKTHKGSPLTQNPLKDYTNAIYKYLHNDSETLQNTQLLSMSSIPCIEMCGCLQPSLESSTLFRWWLSVDCSGRFQKLPTHLYKLKGGSFEQVVTTSCISSV